MNRLSPLVAAPHIAWMAAFFLLPVALMAYISLLQPSGIVGFTDTPSLTNYLRILGEPYPAVAGYSLAVATAATVICLLMSIPLALGIFLAPERWRFAALLAVCLPFWVSTLVRMFALQEILGHNGMVNQTYEKLWGALAFLLPALPAFEPSGLLFSTTGVVIGLVYAFLPFGVLPIYAAMAGMDRGILEASTDLGARPSTTILKIVLPLSKHGIYAAATLVFVPSLGAFYVAEMLGGPGDVLIGNLIELQFNEANNWPFGAALSMSMLLLTACAFLVWRLPQGRGGNV